VGLGVCVVRWLGWVGRGDNHVAQSGLGAERRLFHRRRRKVRAPIHLVVLAVDPVAQT